ncbi:RING/U-box [Glarea lozoyensis ATCC 20868]|uniref:RING/U-box n=1 Tax=Glarea lozoyensis (strain ATCC 20868 / MF5171) TaxID=1116229 RepID=S3D0X6_GLAL2|nr:RING/U-box [Glarea lozoyensis ATCC 20868]EPE31510.1 RING/U-box [Glarea lozoyensis ATCC 20868]
MCVSVRIIWACGHESDTSADHTCKRKQHCEWMVPEEFEVNHFCTSCLLKTTTYSGPLLSKFPEYDGSIPHSSVWNFTAVFFNRANKFRDLVLAAQIESRNNPDWMLLNGRDILNLEEIQDILIEGVKIYMCEAISRTGTASVPQDIQFLIYWIACIVEWNLGTDGRADALRLADRAEDELDGKFVKPYFATPVVLKEDESKECSICLEVMTQEQPVELPCGHIFGNECLYKHVYTGQEGDEVNCPLCRDKFDESTHEFPSFIRPTPPWCRELLRIDELKPWIPALNE